MTKDLKKIRKEHKLSKEKLAEIAGVSVRTIYDFENGKRKVKKDTFQRIINGINEKISYEEYSMNLIDNKLHSLPGLSLLNNTPPSVLKENLKSKLLETNKLFKNEEFQKALDIYLSLSLLFNQEPSFLLGCAMLYEMLHEYEKAIDYSDKVISIDKNNYDALYIKATCLGSLKDYAASINQLEACLNIKSSCELYYNLGVSYQFSNNYFKAIEYYTNCLKININFIEAHLNIGICYLRIFNYSKCKLHIEKALELNPNMYQANATFGDYYRDLGEHTKAVPFYKNRLKFDSENYGALYGLFMCLSFIGDESGSEFYSRKFFSLYSDTFFNDANDTISEENTYNSTIIGIPMIYDETGSTPYPTIAKIFNSKSDFNNTVTKIKDSINLFQYFDNPIYIDIDKQIKVNILALDNDLLIQILFGEDYKLLELNVDKKDLNLFIELFNKYKQFRIHLEYRTTVLLIDSLKNITFKLQ